MIKYKLHCELVDIISSCIAHIEKKRYKSFDLFDALTSSWISNLTKKYSLLRRIAIQINAKSPINLHWLGMKKMVHTKLVSDLLWYFSLNRDKDKSRNSYKQVLELKNKGNNMVWGLNFPYTSRFISADSNTPNIYNTTTTGISICEYISQSNDKLAGSVVQEIIESLFTVFKFKDEGHKGWFSYYPGQKAPTYNVNALTAYFLCKAHYTLKFKLVDIKIIKQLIQLLIEEQNEDGSWYYSRLSKGKWIDSFHSGFIIESLAYVYSHGYKSDELYTCLKKAWKFYIINMFTKDGFPKYFIESDKYPVEAQNCAQAIQTIATVGLWLKWNEKELLEKVIENTINVLYDKKGFFYYKKERSFLYKQSYLRWSTSPMLVALKYSELYLYQNDNS
ncbi:hypothetical protein QWY87_03815 [Lutimonas halocynthiae]|uniref:hypothetical protein n=1 Tax=Lutimonas halocynthiae TaxID=1446477 RepID=UPI0025B4BD53|nr:hypothetical protein [Lutimonas halocynthiae]MDN3641812.1 hypothetical protein [Lutimonas halocynthiae]